MVVDPLWQIVEVIIIVFQYQFFGRLADGDIYISFQSGEIGQFFRYEKQQIILSLFRY